MGPRFEPRTDSGVPGPRYVSGLLDRRDDATGPLPEPAWWFDGSAHPSARHSAGDDDPGRPGDAPRPDTQHPSAPLPPMPSGVWDRLQPRTDGPVDDDATVAQPVGSGPDVFGDHDGAYGPDDHPADDHDLADGRTDSWEQTGGLDVIGSHVDDEAPRGRRGRRRRDRTGDGLVPGAHDEAPHDDRGGRRRRRPWAVLLSVLVLGGLVAGIVLGGQALMGLFTAEDYTGQGTGDVQVRVQEGDTLSDIARTLVDEDVIASTGPFVDAADGRPEATGIQPGVYGLRSQMSGAAALDMLLGEGSRVLSKVTIPEGLTVAQILERIATETGTPIEELQAAAADLPALGLPAYANGQLEGYLYPATYDVEPDQTAAQILAMMVDQFTSVAAGLDLEGRAAAAGRTPADVVTVASMIQSETRLDEERPDVAQVIYNRLAQNIPLGIDATLAYGLDKSGNDLTVTDLRTDSPYNTRTRTGLTPTPISSPGEASLEAALTPTSGDLLYYVLENADGTHFFTADYAEFQAARQRCAQAGLGCGG
ncbi:endolytic transglycosylase MltG [Blastococcus sp. TF02-09]|uniref:endolytic transglycosylase MltG n=1 Tax=Blastococcus sp. TF02-09 TaxID=2250576 RepID=UPI000DEA343A|nr:endolytic transglycosylase MltG [Blastococcus sp. TF02-9]RBY79117.1 endolytic transglycosylase MltG [Blastococcus sp. TF02-9]